jgi:hypothetical protein
MKSKLKIPFSQYGNKNEYQRAWRKLNPEKCKEYEANRDPEKTRETAWERRYGLSREDYEELLKSQGGVCAICSTSEVGREHKYFHVDHDHISNKVRGLLCDKCNRGLGYFNDRPLILSKAASYLKAFQHRREHEG